MQQFQKEGHLRWDSLGEYMALAASLQHLGENFDNPGALTLGEALDQATAEYLNNSRAPAYRVHQMDNRGSAFYLTLYWARALVGQSTDDAMARRFAPVAAALSEHEDRIMEELNAAQGPAQDLGGYFMPDPERAAAAMRPSATLNRILEGV